MVEENKDLNKGQAVTDPDLNAQPVTEPGVSDSAGVQQDAPVLADGTSQDKDVPYSKFKEANEAKKVAEDAQLLAEQQLQQSRDQMTLIQANQTQVQAPKPTSTYEQALLDCGLRDAEYLSREEEIKIATRQEQLNFARAQQQQVVIANQQFAQSHSDFGKVVGQFNPVTNQFMASAELQKILMEKPHLQPSCLTAQGAYEIVMQERKLAELSQKTSAMQEHQVQQQVDANLAPMSPAAAGGGAVSKKAGLITESSTADDVRALERKVKAGEFG